MWRYVIGRIVPYWLHIQGQTVYLIGLLDPEDGSTTITRNVRNWSPSNTASHPTRRLQQHRCENFYSFVDQTPTWLSCFKLLLNASHAALWFTFSKMKAIAFGHKTLARLLSSALSSNQFPRLVSEVTAALRALNQLQDKKQVKNNFLSNF